jgi:hypothetical protein
MVDVGAMVDLHPVPDPALDQRLTAIEGVLPLGTFTVATLPAPAPEILGRLAKVSDLFGDTFDAVRCCRLGSLYYWKPASSDSARPITLVGDMVVGCLTHPQSVRLNGTIGLGTNRTIQLDPTGGWPGAVKEFSAGGLGTIVGTLNIAGAGLGSAVALLTGGYKKFVLDYSSGALAWVQLI